MNILEKNEIDGIHKDNEASKALLEQNMSNFARELNNGLGEQMIDNLRNPGTNKIETGFVYRLKQWWKSIRESFNFMLYS